MQPVMPSACLWVYSMRPLLSWTMYGRGHRHVSLLHRLSDEKRLFARIIVLPLVAMSCNAVQSGLMSSIACFAEGHEDKDATPSAGMELSDGTDSFRPLHKKVEQVQDQDSLIVVVGYPVLHDNQPGKGILYLQKRSLFLIDLLQ